MYKLKLPADAVTCMMRAAKSVLVVLLLGQFNCVLADNVTARKLTSVGWITSPVKGLT
jgi:hypothetical protein